ncbi:MAG TPA: bifunctional hydroxymethylpyrimidine kinase/phosphomethylpyrimidine kinase, partial [Thermohalobaculum sp.]|nr:bifunctional hydroxymethylpyrimidine kinase/phosphomethylpyrimidine kinase [Thermohalobaculum sp.]
MDARTDNPGRTAAALTIAGSDSGGGAGIQADIKTFSALGVYGASVLTAVTAQNTRAVLAVHELPPGLIARQIEAVLDDIRIGAVKVGMLSSPGIMAAVAEGLAEARLPVVLDPVMVAKSGDPLLPDDAVGALRHLVLPLAMLLTPNLPEAARLLGRAPAATPDEMEEQGRALIALGPRAVLMKGGHGSGPVCTDLLVRADGPTVRLEAPRHATRNTHGTGCTLSSAIAALLARGQPLEDAVRGAHDYLQGAIAAADGLGIGRGRGPVHHFHRAWAA